jgi:hypothetical protein
MTFFMASSRTLRDGQMIQEKTTVSSSLRLTAIGNDVNLPSGTSSPQHASPPVEKRAPNEIPENDS